MSDPHPPPSPTAEQRRAAACLAMSKAPGLIRFAARYTRSLHDAEDAYQRSMEIALQGAPVTEPRRFMAWLHTVLRHEALAVARARRREGPGVELDVAEACAERVADAVAIDAVAEWRERYRFIQDGLAGLTDAQRVCLILQSGGASYERIRQITGYSLRKVERSVLEGRASLQAWEVRLASGAECERLQPQLDRVVTGAATARERRAVSRHVRHCGPCRAVLRNRRESNEWLAALVPLAFLASETATARPPDPSPALAWLDRVLGGASVRAGNAIQMAMELPSGALAKVGAGTAAVAVAGAAGAPLVADAVRPDPPPPPTASIERAATGSVSPRAGSTGSTGAKAAPFATARRRAAATVTSRQVAGAARRPARATLPARPDPPPARVTARATPPASPPAQAAPDPSPAPAAPAPSPAPTPAPAPAPAALAMEFGP
jgi:DNA-directed RNA polymerase specialized sigma24 family protein